MGKRRSNRNKRNKNVLKDHHNEKKASAVFEKDKKKENVISSDNGSSSAVQEELLDLQLSKHDLIPSLKEKSDILKSNPSVSLSKSNKDGALKRYESHKANDISNPCISQEDTLQNSHSTNIYPENYKANKTEEICSSSVNKKNESGSDEEYETSDFFQPVLHGWHKGAKFENMLLPEEQHWEENFHGIANKDSYYRKKNFTPVAGYSGFSSSCGNHKFQDKKLKQNISSSVNAYKSSKDSFSSMYHTWLSERRNTLAKLRTLYTEIHDDQLNYNRTQAGCRELGFISRAGKQQENVAVGFLASFTAFLSDAASGVVSVAQAFNIDYYQSKFQEIMNHDAEITKCMYEARSQCVVKYQDIEEVMRKFHSDTFSLTVDKISNALEVDKYWTAMKNAYGNDDMPKLLNIVSTFFDNACQSEKLGDVSHSIQNYVSNNPAALEACKAAGRATYGALDTWGGKNNQNSVLGAIKYGTNQYLMIEDKEEAVRLRNVIDENLPQSKLESQIEDAIYSLESEMKEISDIYFKLFKINIDSDDDIFA